MIKRERAEHNLGESVMDNADLVPQLENEEDDSAQTTEALRRAELEKKLKAQEKNLKNEIIDWTPFFTSLPWFAFNKLFSSMFVQLQSMSNKIVFVWTNHT